MVKKQIFSWQDIENDVQKLADFIKTPVNLIVAITKGGLPIATILANKYLNNPPVITLQLKEIQTEGQANYQANKIKLISPLNNYPIKNKKVLIIDDVADSGFSLTKAVSIVKKHRPASLTTAALHYKPRSSIKPDYFARAVKSHIWIVYPWEKP